MKKIGRNEKCPCLSGKKYKNCCALKPQTMMRPMSQENQMKIRLQDEVDLIRAAGLKKQQVFRELGVFLLFSTKAGDAWLLEITDGDCVQLTRGGEAIDVSIEESPETIVVDWSHTFEEKNRQLVVTSYEDRQKTIVPDAPTGEICSTIRRLRKRHSEEFLSQVHLDKNESNL
jgi:hypothetical protein